jgi:hypothetical protein
MNIRQLDHQFIVRRDSEGFQLDAHPALPKNAVTDVEGRPIGFLLGWPIRVGRLVQEPLQLPIRVAADSTADLEPEIYALGGRFAFVFLTPWCNRLYLDAGGTLAAVYSARYAAAGSTVSALVDRPERCGVWPDNRPNQFFAFGTTADPGINRLLPSHYLDLGTWRPVRHYAPFVEFGDEKDVAGSVLRIVSLIRQHIGAVVNAAPHVYMPLTAGRDSRMLLACSRDWASQITYVTFDYRPCRKQYAELVDLDAGKKLAARFCLRHVVVPVHDVPNEVRIDYLRRIGSAAGSGKARDFYQACRDHLDLSGAWLTGFGGEVGRAFYWRNTDRPTGKLSGEELLDRMNLSERYPPLVAAAQAWLEALPALPLPTVLDLVYIEQRLGCWAAPHLYGAAPFRVNLTPFCSREIFHRMLQLPTAYRRQQRLAADVITASWPELLGMPFNPLRWHERAKKMLVAAYTYGREIQTGFGRR